MDLSSPVLEATRARLVARFGASVAEWWSRLPVAIDTLAARWDLAVGDPVGRGNTSLVIRCRRGDGRAAVLKLCPDPSLSRAEARALRAWRSSGRVPALWEDDAGAGALLMEALPDERSVLERAEPVAIDDVAGLIRDSTRRRRWTRASSRRCRPGSRSSSITGSSATDPIPR